MVGSSRSKRPGRRKSACASAARMRQPPESVDKGAFCARSSNPRPVRMRRAFASAAYASRRSSSSPISPNRVAAAVHRSSDHEPSVSAVSMSETRFRFLDEEFCDASIGTDQRLERGPVRGLELLRDARDVVDVRFDSTRGDEFDEG